MKKIYVKQSDGLQTTHTVGDQQSDCRDYYTEVFKLLLHNMINSTIARNGIQFDLVLLDLNLFFF